MSGKEHPLVCPFPPSIWKSSHHDMTFPSSNKEVTYLTPASLEVRSANRVPQLLPWGRWLFWRKQPDYTHTTNKLVKMSSNTAGMNVCIMFPIFLNDFGLTSQKYVCETHGDVGKVPASSASFGLWLRMWLFECVICCRVCMCVLVMCLDQL